MSLKTIDFQKLFSDRLPEFLRTSPRLQYIYAIANVLKDVNIEFNTFSDAINFTIRFNSQTIYLEEYLNRVYDPSLKRIFINTVATADTNYLYRFEEARTAAIVIRNRSEGFTANNFLRRREERAVDIDYTINIPVSITFDNNEVSSRVDIFNAAGKRYTILTF